MLFSIKIYQKAILNNKQKRQRYSDNDNFVDKYRSIDKQRTVNCSKVNKQKDFFFAYVKVMFKWVIQDLYISMYVLFKVKFIYSYS